MRKFILISLMLGALHLAAAAADIAFPQAISDLPADPAAHFCTLLNGMRCEILANHGPRDPVSFALLASAPANACLAPGPTFQVKVAPEPPAAGAPTAACKD
jgi:hypothetical protein